MLAGVRVLAVGVLAALAVPAAAGAANRRPFTVPAVRAWKPSEGTCRVTEHPRVLASSREVLGEARTLAHDIGGRLVLRGPAEIELLHTRPHGGAEGYTLVAAPHRLVIGAHTSAGLFYGGRTLLQLRGRRFPCGAAADRPRYRERGLMIDVGRRYYRGPGWPRGSASSPR